MDDEAADGVLAQLAGAFHQAPPATSPAPQAAAPQAAAPQARARASSLRPRVC